LDAGKLIDDGDPSQCGCRSWASFDAESGVEVAWDDAEECPACTWVHDPDSEARRAARSNPQATWARLRALAEQVQSALDPARSPG